MRITAESDVAAGFFMYGMGTRACRWRAPRASAGQNRGAASPPPPLDEICGRARGLAPPVQEPCCQRLEGLIPYRATDQRRDSHARAAIARKSRNCRAMLFHPPLEVER